MRTYYVTYKVGYTKRDCPFGGEEYFPYVEVGVIRPFEARNWLNARKVFRNLESNSLRSDRYPNQSNRYFDGLADVEKLNFYRSVKKAKKELRVMRKYGVVLAQIILLQQ